MAPTTDSVLSNYHHLGMLPLRTKSLRKTATYARSTTSAALIPPHAQGSIELASKNGANAITTDPCALCTRQEPMEPVRVL